MTYVIQQIYLFLWLIYFNKSGCIFRHVYIKYLQECISYFNHYFMLYSFSTYLGICINYIIDKIFFIIGLERLITLQWVLASLEPSFSPAHLCRYNFSGKVLIECKRTLTGERRMKGRASVDVQNCKSRLRRRVNGVANSFYFWYNLDAHNIKLKYVVL